MFFPLFLFSGPPFLNQAITRWEEECTAQIVFPGVFYVCMRVEFVVLPSKSLTM